MSTVLNTFHPIIDIYIRFIKVLIICAKFGKI